MTIYERGIYYIGYI